MNQETLDYFYNRKKEIENRQNEVTLDGILETLEEINNERNKVTEFTFVNYFLPHFINRNKSAEQDEVFARWASLAGNLFKEVDVVDEKGAYLYTVPPLCDRNVLDNKNIQMVDYSVLQEEYLMRKNHMAETGLNYLNNATYKLGTLINPVQQQLINRWENILKRYYKRPESTTVDNITITNEVLEAASELDFDYD